MGLLDDLKRKLEAKKEEELKKFQDRKEAEIKKLQDKKDEMLKKVPILGNELKAKEELRVKEELRAKEEAERKAKEEERKVIQEAERKAREEEDRKLQEFISKAESGDAQAACQLGMWFQHGENGIRKNIDKAIYWYQKAAMFGNQAALTFLNMVMEEKKTNEKNESDEKSKRAQYETEDEYLANEKNDPEAAVRCMKYYKKLSYNYFNRKQHEKQLSCLKQALFYSRLSLKLGVKLEDLGSYTPELLECEAGAASNLLKLLTEKQEILEKKAGAREISRREEEKQRRIKEENTVRVRFSADFYYTDYAGRHDRSDYWNRDISKEEYNALLAGGTDAVANYIRSNLFNTWTFPKDSVITRATMQKM